MKESETDGTGSTQKSMDRSYKSGINKMKWPKLRREKKSKKKLR